MMKVIPKNTKKREMIERRLCTSPANVGSLRVEEKGKNNKWVPKGSWHSHIVIRVMYR